MLDVILDLLKYFEEQKEQKFSIHSLKELDSSVTSGRNKGEYEIDRSTTVVFLYDKL